MMTNKLFIPINKPKEPALALSIAAAFVTTFAAVWCDYATFHAAICNSNGVNALGKVLLA